MNDGTLFLWNCPFVFSLSYELAERGRWAGAERWTRGGGSSKMKKVLEEKNNVGSETQDRPEKINVK